MFSLPTTFKVLIIRYVGVQPAQALQKKMGSVHGYIPYSTVFVQYICESNAKSYKNILNRGKLQYFSTLEVPKCEIFDFRHPPKASLRLYGVEIIKIRAI
jgi:hypothetical protein